MPDPTSAALGPLGKINHFVVLMLENRSFDHVLGSLKAQNPLIAGVGPDEYSNSMDPSRPDAAVVGTTPATAFAMPFDPGHEFIDVQMQLYGQAMGAARAPGVRVDPAPMTGFVYSAELAAPGLASAGLVMKYYTPEKLPAPRHPSLDRALQKRFDPGG